MHLSITNPYGLAVAGTDHEQCIPFEYLDSMQEAGYTFHLDGKKVSAAALKKLKSSETPPKVIGIRCVDTGKVYPNQSAAAKDLGIDPAAVSDSIKTGRPRSGHTFEKVFE